MTLHALLASAESTFGACVSELEPTALTAATEDLKMNVNNLSVSVSVSALNRHDYIGNSMSRAVSFI